MDKIIRFDAVLFIITFSGIICTPSYLYTKPIHTTYGDDNTCTKEYSCVNCTAALICTEDWKGRYKKLMEFNCSDGTPYCDFNSGSCTAKLPSDTCAPIDPDFICSRDGYYPHPTNCQKYYSCIEGVAYALDCGEFYYDSKSETCQKPHPCYTVDCEGKSGFRSPYLGDYSFYGYCFNGAVLKLDKCPGRFELDPSTQDCVPVCREPGRQGDPHNCTKYYKCSYGEFNDTLSLYHYQCPNGEVYDSLNSACIPQLPNMVCQSGIIYIKKDNISEKLKSTFIL